MLQRAPRDPLQGDSDAGQSDVAMGPGAAAGRPLPYRQATNLLDCIRIMGEANADECRHQILGTPRPVPPICVPAGDPGWSDFTGTAPASSSFAAETDFHFEVMPTDWGFSIIRAIFDGASSWRKPPSGPTRAAVIADCLKFMPGGTYNLTAVPTCAAAIQPNPALQATTAAECTTVIGAEFDRVAAAESARLLKHEQYHFRLACAMASKGTAALRQASPQPADQIRNIVATKANNLTTLYDNQTTHGCNQASQDAWQQRIDGGLPGTTVP